MKRIFLITTLIPFLLFAQSKVLTIEESIQIGLVNSSLLKISESNLRSADAGITEASSRMLPQLSLSAGYTYMNLNDPKEIGLGPVGMEVINPFSLYGMQLSIQQPLFTGFQISSSRSAAENNYEAVSYEHQRNLNNKALEIYTAFWNLFKSKRQYKLTQEYLISLKDNLEQTKNFLDNGLATRNDYLKMKVQVSNAEVSLIDTKNNMEIARASFNKAIGLPLSEQTDIDVSITSFQQETAEYQTLLKSALNKRDELKSLDYRIKAGEDLVTAANSGWWPKLYASGNFFLYNATAKTFGIEDEKLQAWFVGLSLNWDLWDWGYTSSQSAQAEERVLQNQESLKLLKEQIELETYSAYLNLNSQQEKINVSQLAVESAEENLRLTQEKYDYNLATSNDLIDAEVEVLDAKTKLAFSNADYEIAKAKLEVTVGNRIY